MRTHSPIKNFNLVRIFSLIAILSAGCGVEESEAPLFVDGLPEIGSDEGALCTGITVTRDVVSPTVAGTAVTFTVDATCAAGEQAEYRFLLRKVDTTVVYSEVQAYSARNTWVWDTTDMPRGTYYVMIQARAAGSLLALQSWRTAEHVISSAKGANCAQNAALTWAPNPTKPGVITLTASATCTLGAQGSFAFMMKPEGTNTFSVIRDYARASTFDWNTNGLNPGLYVVLMYVRDEIATVSAEGWKAIQVTATGGVECADVQLNRVTPTPQAQGTLIKLNADTICNGKTVPEVQYYVKLEGEKTYSLLRDWGSTDFTWETAKTPAGIHILMVLVRGKGRNVDYDDWQTGYFELTVPKAAEVPRDLAPQLTAQIAAAIASSSTPSSVRSALQNNVAPRLADGLKEMMKGEQKGASEKFREGVNGLLSITTTGYDTKPLLTSFVSLAVMNFSELIDRAQTVMGPTHSAVVTAKSRLATAQSQLNSGSWSNAMSTLITGVDGLQAARTYLGNFCTGSETNSYTALICKFQTARDQVLAAYNSTRSDKLKEASAKMNEGLLKLMMLDVDNGSSSMEDAVNIIAMATNVKTESLQQSVALAERDAATLYLADTLINGINATGSIRTEANTFFNLGVGHLAAARYTSAMDAFDNAIDRASP